MKITIDISNEQVKYSYEVGTSRQAGEQTFSVSWLEAFVDIVRLAHRASIAASEERREQIMRDAIVKEVK